MTMTVIMQLGLLQPERRFGPKGYRACRVARRLNDAARAVASHRVRRSCGVASDAYS